jgi:serine/threonine-protein kinase
VKRIGGDEDPTTLHRVDQTDDLTLSSISPAPPPAPDGVLSPGTRVGDYVIEEKVGQGGMGSVYRAVHPVIGKYAAIKVLDGALGTEQYNVERFLDEARVVNQIGHPNIVDVFAFGETADGRSYLVMEWLKGETLRNRIDRALIDPPAPLQLPEICEILRPLTRALHAAHEKGVIHRDLKPDNVFLVDVHGEVPIVKLLDFGIAKPSSTEHRVAKTATGALVGTPLYIAPEQAKGRPIDSAADVYALGGMLFELLCKRPPFVADNAMEIVAKHLMEAPPRPSTLVPVPRELDDLVIAMLAKEPVQRPLLAAVMKVLDAVKDLPVSPSAEMMKPYGSDIDLPQWQSQPAQPRIPGSMPSSAAIRSPFEEPIVTPTPMRPLSDVRSASEPGEPWIDRAAHARPTAVAGPMTVLTHTPSPRWKWVLLAVAVVAVGGVAFAVTSAVGGGPDELPQPAISDPEPAPPPLRAEQPPAPKPEPTVEPIEPKPTPAAPSPAATAPAQTTPSRPPTNPAPTVKPTTQRTTTPATRVRPPPRRLPTPKPKPTGKGSGTIPPPGDLAEPGTFSK